MDGEPLATQILLVAQVLISRDEQVKLGLGASEEVSIDQPGPAHLESGSHRVTRERTAQRDWCALVEQDSHPWRPFVRSHHRQAPLRVLQHRLDLLAGDAGKPSQEIFHRGPVLEVLKLSVLHSKTAAWINRLDSAPGRKVWYNYRETKLSYQRSYLARLNYVHQNPVRHGLVPVANQYPWCSAAWFERTASVAMVKSIYRFNIEEVKVYDEFDADGDW